MSRSHLGVTHVYCPNAYRAGAVLIFDNKISELTLISLPLVIVAILLPVAGSDECSYREDLTHRLLI
jgi:hypothetical protein